VSKVETGAEDQRQAEAEVQRALVDEARQEIPKSAFDIPLDDLGVSPRLTIKITGEGYSTIGDLMLQLAMNPDQILGIDGVGPKTIEEFQNAIEAFDFPEPEPVAEEAIEAEETAELDVELTDVEAAEGKAELVPAALEEARDEDAGEEEEEPEEELSFEQALADSEITFIDNDFEDGFAPKDDKGDKKRKKYHQVEYDPDLDVTIVRRRRKRDGEEWDEDNWE
jgi:N utilization substance protein A